MSQQNTKEELEQLKELMQTQVDVMLKKSDTDNWEEFITEAKKDKAELFELASEYETCEICQEKFLPKNSETICSDCALNNKRKKFKKLSIAGTAFFAIIFVVIVIIYMILEII
ncbi:MAG: hypothetical protein Q4E28_00835 [Clostridia bacterium]|nr:hypothetical protein [Clostridia bacterium]